jgi:hypothetical protein
MRKWLLKEGFRVMPCLSGDKPVDEDFACLFMADFRPLEDKFNTYQCLNNASVITPLHSTEGQ